MEVSVFIEDYEDGKMCLKEHPTKFNGEANYVSPGHTLAFRGEYSGVTHRKIAMSLNVVESLRLEIITGKPHCTVCLGQHPNHECPRRNK